MTKLRKMMTSALAATMLVGSISVATPASAYFRGYGWHGGWARPAAYGWGGGWRRGGWGYGGWGYGGAAAAGLLGGLALGTVAAASPWGYGGYGGYSYPYGGYGYYGAAYPAYGGGCSCW